MGKKNTGEILKKHHFPGKITGFILLGLIAAVLAVLAGLFATGKIRDSRQQDIKVEYRVVSPGEHRNLSEPIPALRVLFAGSAARQDMANKAVNEGLVVIKPGISGSWSWKDDNVLFFQPEQEWDIGMDYEVTMSGELFPDHIRIPKLKFDFETPRFTMDLEQPEFYIDPLDPLVKRILARVVFNYPVNMESLEGKIRIHPDLKSDSGTFVNKNYAFDLKSTREGREIYITSEPMGIPLEDVDMQIEISKGVTHSGGKGQIKNGQTRSLGIPGISTYVKIHSLSLELLKNSQQVYDQILVLNTKGETSIGKLLDYFEVWQLPRDRPSMPGMEGSENYFWNNPGFVTEDVLKLATRVRVTALPSELENSCMHSFQIDVEPGKFLFVRIREGAPFYGGYYLSESHEQILKVREYPREVAIVSEGNLLSLSGDKRLSLFSRGVSNVEYKIHRILHDDINHLVSQSNGNLRDFQFRNYHFSIDNISKTYSESISLNMPDTKGLKYFSLDMSKYLSTISTEGLRFGLFMIEVGERKKNDSLNIMDKRLLIVSDLAMLVKTNQDGSKDVFVQSIATGLPVEGASIWILGKNGISLVYRRTDSQGHGHFKAMDFSREENTPTAFLVNKDEDLSFLPYESPGRFLDYSGFDVGGVYGAGDPGQLTTQLFSDRGLYRPGDRVNGAFIIKAGDWNKSVGGTPLLLHVTDPRGQIIHEESIILSAEGFNDFSFSTQDYSPTGLYTISLYLAREGKENIYLGGDDIKVEEFLPDRLKVDTSFSREAKGWISPETLKVHVSVRNLHGAPAAGNKVAGGFRLSPVSFNFPQFREYHFFQPERTTMSYDEELQEGMTDEEGFVSFTLAPDNFEKASYRLNLSVDAHEKSGGRSVASQASILVSPFHQLIGYKADGDLGYIHKGAQRNVELIAINGDLEKIPFSDGILRISAINYVSTLVKNPNGVYQYESIEKNEALSSKAVDIARENTIISLDSLKPGKYRAEILDPGGNVLNGFVYTVVGEANLTRSLNRSAELEIKLDKKDYMPGESMEISITAPYEGAGIITLERDRVYSYKWFRTNTNSTIQRISLPASDLEGNGYVSVAFVRSPDSKEIFMSPLSYGSVPFSLSKDSRNQKITLVYPDLVKPGEEIPITYSTNRRGRIVIYAVDEGILQVGRYQLPDPLGYFFRKRALEVQTAQVLDLILPDYSVVRSFAEMGGGGGEDMLASNLNPFKRKDLEPAVFWSGILDSGPDERTLSYRLPGHFNGSLRIMAVAVSRDAVGSAMGNSLVQDSFIIQPSAPLAVIPGDEFICQATIANKLAGSGANAHIRISISAEEGLVPGNTEQTIPIPEGKDAVVRFPVRVGDTLGDSALTIRASASGESSTMVHPLSIRPAVPYRTSITTSVLKGKSQSLPLNRDMYSQYRKQNVSASWLPLGLAGGLSFYLEDYPYTCTEQLISINFPKLYDGLVKNLDIDPEARNGDFSRTIAILQSRQKPDGSFGMWTAKSRSVPLIDLYAFQFLLEAAEKGRFVPQNLLDRARERAGKIAAGQGESPEELQLRAYAIFLLTSRGIITAHPIEALRKALESQGDDWKTGLTGLYLASSYGILQMKLESGAILREIKRSFKQDDYNNDYHDRLSFLSQYLMILSRYDSGRLKDLSPDLLEQISREIMDNHYTSFSASMALVGIQSYLDVQAKTDNKAIEIRQILQDGRSMALNLTGSVLKRADLSGDAASIDVGNNSTQALYFQLVQGGFDRGLPEAGEKHKLEISREILDKEGKAASELLLGESYDVSIRIRTTNRKTVHNVAVVDLLPACLEAQGDIIRQKGNAGDSRKQFQSDYMDIREDRLVFYGSADENSREYIYPVKAVYPGTFQLPPLFAEAMYDHEVWALSGGSRLTVRE